MYTKIGHISVIAAIVENDLTSSANCNGLLWSRDNDFFAPRKSCFCLINHAGDSGIMKIPKNANNGNILETNAVV